MPPTGAMPPTPPPDDPEPDKGLRNAVIGASIAVVVVALILVGVLVFGGDDEVATDGTTTSLGPSTTAPTTSTTAPTTSTTAPTTTAAPGAGVLTVSPGTIDFGSAGTQATLEVRNDGGAELRYTATTSSSLVTLDSQSGTIGPGESDLITVRFARDRSPEGNLSHQIVVDAGGGQRATIPVSGRVIIPPEVGRPETPEATMHTSGCAGFDDRMVVTARATDESGLDRVELHWESAENGNGNKLMDVDRDGEASAELGPFGSPGIVTVRVVAVDVNGNTGTSEDIEIEVLACPVS